MANTTINISLKSKSNATVNLTSLDGGVVSGSSTSIPVINFVATGTQGPIGAQGDSGVASIDEGQITSEHLSSESVGTSELANESVTYEKLGVASVAGNRIMPLTITTTKIGNQSVTQSKLANNSVGADQIINESITQDLLQDLAVNGDKISDLSITSGKLQDLAVTTIKVRDRNITGVKIASNADLDGEVKANNLKLKGSSSPATLTGPDAFALQLKTNTTLDVLNASGETKASIDQSGNLTLSGTVDGRDIAIDGAKLDTISANDAIDWTIDQGGTNIHTGNYTDTDTVYTHPANHAISVITGLQDALDSKVDDSQVLTDVPSGALFTDTNTTYTAGTGLSLSGTTLKTKGAILGSVVNLDTYRTTGVFSQNSNGSAAAGTNYPVDYAGILEVVNDDYGNGIHTTQRYSQYNSTNVYHRYYYNGTWSSWINLSQDTVYTLPFTDNSSIWNAKPDLIDEDDMASNSATKAPSQQSVKAYADAHEEYIASRGENLMSNNSGLLGDNQNFSTFVFDGSVANSSPGSFKHVGTGTKFTDEYMAVNASKRYKMSVDAKTLNGVGRYYMMTSCYDVDNNTINASHHMYRANTLTTLAVELVNGATTITLTDSANWNNAGTAGSSNHLRSLIRWDYTNSFGYTYPPETYSRNWLNEAWDPGNINFTTHVITLRVPWAGGTIAAGTKVSNGSSGGTYKYNVMGNVTLTTDWVTHTGYMDGLDLSGTNVTTKFPPGTAKIRMGWLMNYQGTPGADTAWFTNLFVGLDYLGGTENAVTATALTSGNKTISGELYTTGDAGIGTSSPSYRLDVNSGPTNVVARFKSTDNESAIRLEDDDSSYELKASSLGLRFVSNDGSERVRFEDSGDVGIGVTNAMSKLHVGGTFQVGVDDTGHDVKFFGATTGASMLWDESEDGLLITHPPDDAGLEIYTVSGAGMNTPQFKVGRNVNEWLGVYTGDRTAHIIHRQDETDSYPMNTSFELWGGGSGNDNWVWRHGTNTGGSLATVMTLDKAGQLTVTGNVGIGTTSPGEKLDVVGNVAVSGTVTASDFIGPLNGAVQFTAKNTSGGTLTVGQVVYISGISGNTPTVGLADADDPAKMPAYGLVAVETSNNDPVEIVTFGPLTHVKTDYAGWAVGDTLYVSTTPGTLTNVAPTGEGTLIQNLGRIRRVQQSAGSITVGGAGRTNATPNLNEGRLFVGNASNQSVADGTAYIDIANGRVGIGTTSPSEKLDVVGNANISGSLTATTLSVTNYGLASGDIPNNAADTTGTANALAGTGNISSTPGTGELLHTGQISSSTTGLFPTLNNANSIITLNKHSGNYFGQLGFSSNANLYYRNFNNAALSTNPAWSQIAFTDSDITGNAATATVLTSGDKTIDGKLGVGVSPFYRLDVRSSGTDTGQIHVRGGNTTVTALNEINSELLFGSNDFSITGGIGGKISSVTEATNGAHAGLAFHTFTQSSPLLTEKVRIANTGNVGIGTTSPSEKLHVVGDALITTDLHLTGSTSKLIINGTETVQVASGVVTIGQGNRVLNLASSALTSNGLNISTQDLYIKILPRDFIADDGGRPLAIDDTGGDRWIESHSSYPMFASVEIPTGYKATHVDIYGNGTSAVTVYEANINARSVTSKGTGNIGTQINITDVTSNATNYLLIQLVQVSGEQVNGGKVTIAKV